MGLSEKLLFSNELFSIHKFCTYYAQNYAGIIYYARLSLLCSKICQHNVPKPTEKSEIPV